MIFFLPSVDGKLVTKNKAGLTNDQFHSKPYIVGCNSTEGSGIMSVERPPNFIEGITEEMCMGVLKGFMGVLFYVRFLVTKLIILFLVFVTLGCVNKMSLLF